MLFSSTTFLFVFLPIVLAIYFICPKRFRNLVLLISSLIFYAWGEIKYLLVMLVTILVNYILALVCAACKERKQERGARAAVIGTVIFSIGMLAFFKYSNFFLENINHTIGQMGGFRLSLLNIALPLGISFYTFQTLSYTIDVYRGEVKPQKNILTLATYVCLFPQLIAGPIVRYQTVAGELEHRQESTEQFGEGIRRFITGLGKKVLLANTAGSVFEMIQAMGDSQITVGLCWMASIAYSFQIYFDFSGYSDMAIGLGKMFGFQFLENFNYPYISRNITEFWRRWHISLSSWFKEYVYIPLGGNRCGKARMCLNIMIVWFLTGLWHGASYNFILWGVYYGLLLMVEKLFLKKYLRRLPKVVSHIYTMLFVMIGWVLFASEHLKGVISYLSVMFGNAPLVNSSFLYLIRSNFVFLIIGIIASLPVGKELYAKLPKKSKTVLMLLLSIVSIYICTAYLLDSTYNPFLYFRF